ncbi:MAG: class I SAM-dependent methyltransferase [Bacteroidetes bacterium]|nr:class I SAM-dependent methyltransferase [Bacteroidota bacterium]
MNYVINYLIYRLKSVNEHGVHSPFVFDLLLGTIYNRKAYYSYKNIENIRKELLLSKQTVNCIDLGAGSRILNNASRSISEIANVSAKPSKYAQLLFEGCEEIAAVAKGNFKKLKLENIRQVIGGFDEVLPDVLKKIEQLDLVFFDGNHRKIPTLNYFQQCLEKAVESSVFIFDDIYWSEEMKAAWQEIKNNERVTVTVDLFHFGIVFFRKEQVKEHFIIRF